MARKVSARHRRAGLLAAATGAAAALLILGSAPAHGQESTSPLTPIPEVSPVEAPPTVESVEQAPSSREQGSSNTVQESPTSTAVITGLVTAGSAILGVAITQFGAFRLSRNQRRGDRTVAQLDELRMKIGELDAAYAQAAEAEFASSESRALDGAIRSYERAWRMVDDQRIRGLAKRYHEKLKSFTVEEGDLEVEEPTTRADVDAASSELIDRIRSVWSKVA